MFGRDKSLGMLEFTRLSCHRKAGPIKKRFEGEPACTIALARPDAIGLIVYEPTAARGTRL